MLVTQAVLTKVLLSLLLLVRWKGNWQKGKGLEIVEHKMDPRKKDWASLAP